MLYRIGSRALQFLAMSVLCLVIMCDFDVMYNDVFLNVMGSFVWQVLVFRGVTSIGIHLII